MNAIPKSGDYFDLPSVLSNIISEKSTNTHSTDQHDFSKNLNVMFDDFTVGETISSGRNKSNPVKDSLRKYYSRVDSVDKSFMGLNDQMNQAALNAEGVISEYLKTQQQKLSDMGITPNESGESILPAEDSYNYNELISKYPDNDNLSSIKPTIGIQTSPLLFQSGSTSPSIDMVSGRTTTPGSLTSSVSTEGESLQFMVDVQEGYDVHNMNQINEVVQTLMEQTTTLQELANSIELMNQQLPDEVQINTSNYIYTTTDTVPVDLGF